MPGTPAGRVEVETERVKGSRFLAVLAPATSPDAAAAEVARVRADHPDASHHCWAWRLGDGRERTDDDGEPRDTAGAPIARHLAGADLVDVVCVVVRWFGGTKLGRGGLVRAYGDAAAAAIAAAEVRVHVPTTSVRLVHGYDDTGRVDAVLHAHAVAVVDEQYGAHVTRVVEVRAAHASSLRAALTEATSGRVDLTG